MGLCKDMTWILKYLKLSTVVPIWIIIRRYDNSVWELSSCQCLLCFLTVNDWIKLHKYLEKKFKGINSTNQSKSSFTHVPTSTRDGDFGLKIRVSFKRTTADFMKKGNNYHTNSQKLSKFQYESITGESWGCSATLCNYISVHCACLALEWIRYMYIDMLTLPHPGTSTPLIGLGISKLFTTPYLPHSSLTSSTISENINNKNSFVINHKAIGNWSFVSHYRAGRFLSYF